jgi:hypothetical protein
LAEGQTLADHLKGGRTMKSLLQGKFYGDDKRTRS